MARRRTIDSAGRGLKRIGYGIAMVVAIVLGLASRHYADRLPAWLASHAGDALWAAMIYVGFRLLWPQRRLLFSAIGALLFSYAIECSQCYQADWLNRIRATTLGGLVLGHGFLTVDLARYTVGIAAAFLADAAVRRIARRKRP
ncbi:DUF2809 domain-containing protein [Paenibacillus sacheonensis]|uniref:DUF2809 domain-containing protein n=1 Tax=Paenibacillus sacheonensis TaxID=742054 RepID=A0A7X4YPM1_9BACL|nr:DUF2809 domain-containing protein [Paenibacillus sacheonensis]MBM7564713.1 hypothetical protein [Paenibacillus sacheonensis]NBC69269.1 DUF2809 domain-containing protein [Paenibacillus sacheonensis]